MDKYRDRLREVIPDADEDGSWEREADILTHPNWKIRRGPSFAPETPAETAKAVSEPMKPYDPSDYPERDFYNQDDLDHLEENGFFQAEPGVWHRHVADAEGNSLPGMHILTYEPSNGSNRWIMSTNPDSVGYAFSSLRGDRGAMAAANADRDLIIKKNSKVAAGQSPARRNVDDWLSRHTDESFEHAPESNEDWMRAHEGDPDEGYVHWEPSQHDYTYTDFGDTAGQTFHSGEEEGRAHVLPGSAYDFGGHGWETGPAWRSEDRDAWENSSDEPLSPGYRLGLPPDEPDDENDEDYEIPEHEQDLADLGFNWRNRGTRGVTPESEFLNGEWVREQHDPEGNHIATHTLWEHERPDSPSGTTHWDLEHNPAGMPDFAVSHTTHRWPSFAITQYHQNAEQALLPSRGYEPQRGPNGGVTHWTRVDHDPQTGAEYHHEISRQPPDGEGDFHPGWLGQTFASHFNPTYAPHDTRNQDVQTDLADVVREHDRIGRGLHPGGSQDYRLTAAGLLADPSVARLGEPHHISDNFYRDGKVGSARWSWNHPEWPHPINAEATYNWDKGGYDFKYTSDGNRLAASHNYVPEGAPIHVPGRQTQLPLGIDHPFNINDYRGPRG